MNSDGLIMKTKEWWLNLTLLEFLSCSKLKISYGRVKYVGNFL